MNLKLASAASVACLVLAGCGAGDGDLAANARAVASQAAGDRSAAEEAAAQAAADRAASETLAEEAAAATLVAEEAAAAKAAAEKATAEKAAAEKAAAEKAAAEKAAADKAAASKAAAERAAAAAESSQFDREYALDKAADIIEDIKSVDERMQDGIMVASALNLLSDSYGRLASAGVPPKVDEAKYMARLRTLESFAAQAAEEMEYSPRDGSARYAVVREETGTLFTQINSALGTNLRLP